MTAAGTPSGTDVRLRRTLRVGDLARLAELTEGCTPSVSERQLERLVLADPALDRAAVIIAERGDRAVGYMHVTVDGTVAYLVSGVVARDHRRAGIGSVLLESAVAHAREHGCDTLRVSGYPRGYLTPGIDEDADPGTAEFLRARGAVSRGRALAMELELAEPRVPVASDAAEIAPCRPEELPDLLASVRRELPADWAHALHSHIRAGGAATRILRARDTGDGSLLGVAAWGVVDADDERFGPIGVVPAGRGRGIGGALLDTALAAMARVGVARARLLWTGPGSPAHRMYLSRGFRPLSTTTLFEIQVPTAASGRT